MIEKGHDASIVEMDCLKGNADGHSVPPDIHFSQIRHEHTLQSGKINIFNYGDMKRDSTYVDDIVEGNPLHHVG